MKKAIGKASGIEPGTLYFYKLEETKIDQTQLKISTTGEYGPSRGKYQHVRLG